MARIRSILKIIQNIEHFERHAENTNAAVRQQLISVMWFRRGEHRSNQLH